MADEPDLKQPIIIKKIKKGGGGHHGGAWKVAYADFVTAMMAFFLLLWLLNVTTEEQKNAISNYFDPTHPKVSMSESGAGGILAGTTLAAEGAMNSTQTPVVAKTPSSTSASKKGQRQSARDKFEGKLKAMEKKKFEELAKEIKKKIEDTPELAKLVKNLLIDVTPEGLRIQLVDQDKESMFASGSAQMYEKTENLIEMVAQVIRKSPNDISVRGHTDGTQYAPNATYTNWELSADRANASRRALIKAGINASKVSNVQGKADTEHLFAENPLDPRNRRISIVLLNQDFSNVPMPAGIRDQLEAELKAQQGEDKPEEGNAEEPAEEEIDGGAADEEIQQLYEKSQGAIDFP